MAEIRNLAVFCDFENVALGVREAKYDRFDIGKVLERLLLKGSIVVKKAYCDWDRYKEFKAPMHQASFELIEIPHMRQSGKNSADIRMVVDALDLCYTKAHVDTFVIVSGDSDFSPLVSKLRENDKTVIGVGVKKSHLRPAGRRLRRVHLLRRPRARAQGRAPVGAAAEGKAAEGQGRCARPGRRRPSAAPSTAAADGKQQEALELVLETIDAMVDERGEDEKMWGSMVKQALKRRKPGFNESYYGFRSFNELLEEREERGLVELERDDKSGGYIIRSVAPDEE